MSLCQGHETLVQFLEDRLGEPDREALEAHVEGCPACAAALKRLTDANQTGLPFPAVFLAACAPGSPLAAPVPERTGQGVGSETQTEPSGRYQFSEEIGRGGMGSVHRVHDRWLDRDLAVKVLLEAHWGNPALAGRFLREARLCGRLQHPGVVPLYELGELPDGRPFFTMRLVQGQNLDHLLAQRSAALADLPRWLGVFLQVCQVMAYAHSKGVIHRDLKPGNIMVGAFGEVQVMDWGLAKDLGSPEEEATGPGGASNGFGDARQTANPWGETRSELGMVLGTPAYMPPEQARGEIQRFDHRSDVFGLGAILCVILTGEPPYIGATTTDLCRRAREGDLAETLGRLDGCGADGELVGLAKACLAVEPAQRPADAEAVVERVMAYQAGVAQRLRQADLERAATLTRQAEGRKRRWLWNGLAAATALLLGLGGGVGVWYAQQQALVRQDGGRELATATEALRATRLAEARAALGRAEAVLTGRGPLDLQDQLAHLGAQLEWAMELDRIRQDRWAVVEGKFTPQAGGPRYTASFAAHGLAVGESDAEEVAVAVQVSPIRAALVEALNDWWSIDGSHRTAVLAVLRRVDPDSVCSAVREAVANQDSAALRRLAAADVEALSPSAVVVLAEAVGGKESVALLRRARLEHRSDFWVSFTLANMLAAGWGTLAEAEEAYWAALAVRPDSVMALINLEGVLLRRKDLVGAEKACRYALRLDPGFAMALNNLGKIRSDKGDLSEAEEALRKALAVDPGYARAQSNLGFVLLKRKDLRGAEEAFRTALRLDSVEVAAHNGLGRVLLERKELSEAEAAFRAALRLKPGYAPAHYGMGLLYLQRKDLSRAEKAFRAVIDLDRTYAPAHVNLGLILHQRQDLSGAEEAFRAALRLDTRLPPAHHGLGVVLLQRRDLPGAKTAFQAVLQLDPKHISAHYNLGLVWQAVGNLAEAEKALRATLCLDPGYAAAYNGLGSVHFDRKDLPEAEKAFRTALRLDPHDPWQHLNLGVVLREQGRFSEAVAAFRRSHELGAKQPGWNHRAADEVKRAERLAELDRRLPDVLGGNVPSSAAETLEFARLCGLPCKQQHAAAARLFAAAFSVEAKLAADLSASNRYQAACCAALAGCGQGQDSPPAQEPCAALRRQALEWLRADLERWSRQSDDADPRSRRAAQVALTRWRENPDLAGLREPAELRKRPQTEREAWRKLWTDVAALLDKPASSPGGKGGPP
jgi:serine/threonine protein kinase/tetratricopeptide (TPR) repeat protein